MNCFLYWKDKKLDFSVWWVSLSLIKVNVFFFVDKVAVYAQDGDSVEGEDDEDTVVENEDGVEDADQAVTEKEKVRHNDKKHE